MKAKITLPNGKVVKEGTAPYYDYLRAQRAHLATERQIEYLHALGSGKLPEDLTKVQASQMIDELRDNRVGLGYGEDHGDTTVRPATYEVGLSGEQY